MCIAFYPIRAKYDQIANGKDMCMHADEKYSFFLESASSKNK